MEFSFITYPPLLSGRSLKSRNNEGEKARSLRSTSQVLHQENTPVPCRHGYNQICVGCIPEMMASHKYEAYTQHMLGKQSVIRRGPATMIMLAWKNSHWKNEPASSLRTLLHCWLKQLQVIGRMSLLLPLSVCLHRRRSIL